VIGDAALDLFGAERLLYGGEWPVSELVGGYPAWWNAIHPLRDELTVDRHAAIVSETARGGSADSARRSEMWVQG
jgi:L-fuconolactonase